MVEAPLLAVTGATGFLGQHVVRAASERGYRLRFLGRSAPTEADSAWRHFDLADTAPLDPKALEGVDAVIHLAAYIPRNKKDGSEAETCFHRNALGTLRLMQAAHEAGVPRFIHTVGANAYAPGQDRPDETAQMLPTHRGTFYLMSKVTQEAFATNFGQANGMRVCALRVSTPCGPAQQTGVIASFTRSLIGGELLQLANGGRYGTDWVDADDVAAALFIALEKDEVGPLNVGSGVRTTMAEVADMIARALGVTDARVELLPFDDPFDLGFPALNIDRIRRLGYMPAAMPAVIERCVAALTNSNDAPAIPSPASALQKERSA
jgi:UDP-glucose 4-epimerase